MYNFLIGNITSDADDDSDMEDDRDEVKNKEEEEAVDLLDLELVNWRLREMGRG